ncbi:MAG: UDP-2,3-diacylglucosamine diphosphatase [Phycisphaerae bacterium]|nr:UDP-2,3-diacylglucosamine diphosphatase [Phycisphaerae bacterium]
MVRTRYRTVWISDTHLGSTTVQADELAYFLKHISCDHLYLVGDIIDMWRLRQRWKWPASHNAVIRRILKLSSRGTRVLYVPGNHDDGARQYVGLQFGGIEIALNAAHRTADGRDLLVSHGDQYDLVVRHHRYLSIAGAAAYDALLGVNRGWNAMRGLFGLPYHSLSQAIKRRVKRACSFVSDFEQEIVAEAVRGKFHGVICGHIHKPDIRHDVRRSGISYYNCGDWVESCTALVEHDCGRMEIIDGRAANAATRLVAGALSDPADARDDWPDVRMPFPLPSVGARLIQSGDAGVLP